LPELADTKTRLEEATALLIAAAKENPDEIGAASYAYMELVGLSLYCFMWQRILAASLEGAGDSEAGFDASYLDGLRKTGEFFLARLLPKADGLLAEMRAGAGSLMAMSAEQF